MKTAAGDGAPSPQTPTSEKVPLPEVVEDYERPLPIPPNQPKENPTINMQVNNYEKENAYEESEDLRPKKPLWLRGVMFVCGIEDMDTEAKQKQKEEAEKLKNSPEHLLEAMRDALAGIIESDGMRRVCSANALALLAVGVFIWAYLM